MYKNDSSYHIRMKTIPFILQINPSGGGDIQEGEVKDALNVMGLQLPNHEVRDLLLDLKKTNKCSNGVVSKCVFKEVTFV